MVNYEINFHPKQMEIHQSDARFKIIPCGRRFGKSRYAAYEVILNALRLKEEVTWIVAPRYAQTMIMWRMIKKYLPKEYVLNIREGEKSIELLNGHTIWAKSGDDPDALRGEGLSLCVFDEFAVMKPDVWQEAIQPALMDKKGKGIFIGTPKGKNQFYTMFLQGLDENQPDYESFQFPTHCNPFINKQELVEIKKRLPEMIYKQEILAQFVESGGEVFPTFEYNLIKNYQVPYDQEQMYVAGLDLAKHTDFTVLLIARANTGDTVFYQRYNKLDWEYQIEKIKNSLLKYKNPYCLMDSTGLGDPMYDRLRKEGLNVKGIKISATSKPQLIQNLGLMLENGEISIPDTEEVRSEFSAYTYKITDTGYIKYSAPIGFHDDTVIATALMAWGLKRTCSTIGTIEHEEETEYPEERLVDYDDAPRLADWED